MTSSREDEVSEIPIREIDPLNTPAHMVHQLLFRALTEMRSEGHDSDNKLVFHLADLFHSAVLQMQQAADGKVSYDEILGYLEQRAAEKGCDQWIDERIIEIRAKGKAEHAVGVDSGSSGQ